MTGLSNLQKELQSGYSILAHKKLTSDNTIVSFLLHEGKLFYTTGNLTSKPTSYISKEDLHNMYLDSILINNIDFSKAVHDAKLNTILVSREEGYFHPSELVVSAISGFYAEEFSKRFMLELRSIDSDISSENEIVSLQALLKFFVETECEEIQDRIFSLYRRSLFTASC